MCGGGGVGGGVETHEGSVNYPPGLASVFQGDRERNHMPVLFQRMPGREAIGSNSARRVDSSGGAEGGRGGQERTTVT